MIELPELHVVDPSDYCRTTLLTRRPGTGFPNGLILGRELSKGSNSSVRRAALMDPTEEDDEEDDILSRSMKRVHHCALADANGGYVLRGPRHDSDTIKQSHAQWEGELSLKTAQWKVGPPIYDMWYCARTTREQRHGLYMVMKHYECDLRDAILEKTSEIMEHSSHIGAQIVACVLTLSQQGILLYDIKPSNVVLSLDPLDVRLIDFGRDFCESADSPGGEGVIPALQKVLECEGYTKPADLCTLLGLVMLVQLSAILGSEIHRFRRTLKVLDRTQRHELNGMRAHLATLRKQTSGRMVRVLREALRNESIRSNLRHYLGARDSATRRVFSLSGFEA